MRYDNWDIILFPEDSNIPIQEYRTACYFSQDEDGRELPTLRTYIGSLRPDTPFRISVHHWGVPKPSPLIQEIQRRAGMRIIFTIQVVINDNILYHGSFELNATSPQEIAYEQRSFKSFKYDEQPTSQIKPRLRFPCSDKQALLQSSAWQPRGTDNRIKITLSEQLVAEDDALDASCWDIACFSFQHASRELLEQAGIAYPVIDPLRCLVGERATLLSQQFSQNKLVRGLQRGSQIHPERSPESNYEHMRPSNPEPHQRSTIGVPSVTDFPNAPGVKSHRGGGLPAEWSDSYGPFDDPEDDVNMVPWPPRRYASNMSGLEGSYDPSCFPYVAPPWPHNAASSGQRTDLNMNNNRSRRDKSAQQVITTWRDDQFGQIVEAMAPSKKHQDLPYGLPAQRSTQDRPPTAQSYRPPKMGALSVPVRPSSAAASRKTSYPDFNAALRNSSKRPLSGQANFIPSALPMSNPQLIHRASKENHGTSHARRPMPSPFVLGAKRWDSDVSMRDGSSNFSSLSRFERNPLNMGSKVGSAHAPSAVGNVKSRKEGLGAENGDHLDVGVLHDQSLPPTLTANSTTEATTTSDNPDRTPRNKLNESFAKESRCAEVIDVDAIDPSLVAGTAADMARLSPFKPSHKPGMSSVSSTGLLERQLYSALGEELGSFEQQVDTSSMGPELAQALSGTMSHSDLHSTTLPDLTVGDFEPVAKRKRQDTFGCERDDSPSKKKEKARQVMLEDDEVPADRPRVRGD
ncbi:uncharacterized protein EKO05_0003732 [Ascochyta rabiei]|uniref:Uncharacterized protein n=1 Tax=Didymella rabiei TaxID=5454 RepID=A0A162WIX2_DIDRA|nr:uncharacterized protein EKO05_0003732 [Ascochyta rabiei]KZM19058.1 hypothetical protein ST47_g9802 [Ascochyta rabiei]UPX13210.1 hypothetical protein EKO05_0003732 [Ascochyta rabiei]